MKQVLTNQLFYRCHSRGSYHRSKPSLIIQNPRFSIPISSKPLSAINLSIGGNSPIRSRSFYKVCAFLLLLESHGAATAKKEEVPERQEY